MSLELRSVPADADLVYEQVLPNDALKSMTGNYERQRIVRELLPRLLRSGMLSPPMRRRFQVRAILDNAGHLITRVVRRFRTATANPDGASP